MKCQNDGKYFHGSLERAASHQCCLVKISIGTKTPLKRYHCHWNQIVFGILLPLSFPGNVNVKSVCPVDLLPAVLFSSENDAVFFTACFNSLLLGSNCISFACGALLSIRALCPSSIFKCYFPFLMAGKSISSDLPFLSTSQSEFLSFQLPSTLPETVYFFP